MARIVNDSQIRRIVAVLGDFDRAEMRPLVASVAELISPSGRQVLCRDIRTIIGGNETVDANSENHSNLSDGLVHRKEISDLEKSELATSEVPDLMIVLQSWSDEYSAKEVNDLFAFAPLARIVVCFGAWCESDGRNRDFWPASIRVPVWAAVQRIQQEWHLIQNVENVHPLPWSASREEIFSIDHLLFEKWPETESVGVDSPDPEYQRFLREFLLATGYKIAPSDVGAFFFDADPWTASRISALKSLQEQHPSAVFVGLVSFAHPTFHMELGLLGVEHMVHKLGFRHLMRR